jgi:hypothetical protein
MMDALVEDYFRYDELAQMESEAIRHNITGSDTEVLEYRELDKEPRELISNVEIGDPNGPEEIRNYFHMTFGFLTRVLVFVFFQECICFCIRINFEELDSSLARLCLGARKRDFSEYEPDETDGIFKFIKS